MIKYSLNSNSENTTSEIIINLQESHSFATNNKYKIGIIGNGFVGKTMTTFNCNHINVVAYDTNPLLCFPNQTVCFDDLLDCEIIFISVPTPMNSDGSCHINIIVNILKELNNKYKGFIVLRSTVPVGTCDNLKIRFMPEFLTEKNAFYDFKYNKEWYFGILQDENDELFKNKIKILFELAKINNVIEHNNIQFVLNKEAEMIKLFRNCFLSVKVSFCNEIYDFCDSMNINYETVQKLACSDERIQLSHTQVPGHDGFRGYGGTCFPKDTSSLLYQMNVNNVPSYILKSAIERNNTLDRPSQDWKLDIGRTII